MEKARSLKPSIFGKVWGSRLRCVSSASGIDCDLSSGKFGPFQKQLFVGDQTHSTVMRVFLEKAKGHYQGACFPFRAGFGSGSLALQFAADGSLYVGCESQELVRPANWAREFDVTGKNGVDLHPLYADFGHLVSGKDVVDKLLALQVDSNGDPRALPGQKARIDTVTISES